MTYIDLFCPKKRFLLIFFVFIVHVFDTDTCQMCSMMSDTYQRIQVMDHVPALTKSKPTNKLKTKNNTNEQSQIKIKQLKFTP